MSDNRMKDMLESIARRGVPENINMWLRIESQLNKRNSLMQTLRARPAIAILIVVLALSLLTGVVYAIGKSLGYIPGIGVVEQSVPLRILAEPVVVERDGLTVTISALVADTDHTFVAYSVGGIIVPKMASPICGEAPSLHLPDGSPLEILGIDYGGPQGAQVGSILKLEQSVTYSSIPAGVDALTFTFPCILPEGVGPENWQIPLQLAFAPKEYATPAVEIGATFVASNPEFVTSPTLDMVSTAEPTDPALDPLNSNGSGLYLDKVIELPDSYILVGNFTDTGDLPGPLVINLDPYEDLPHMEDGPGNPVAFKVREDIQPATTWGDRYWVRTWAYEIPKPVRGPVTITLDQINIALSDKTQFSFDAGSNPQIGQKWELDLPVHLRNYDYVIDSVEVIEGGYLFKYHSGIDVPQDLLFLNLPGYPTERNNGRTVRLQTVIEYSMSLIYAAPFPAGQLTVELVVTETVPLQGSWTLTWTPPSQ